ncbi:MAG: hypothetical protein ACOY4H_09850 [Thermodesulfobacteriota bacterium]
MPLTEKKRLPAPGQWSAERRDFHLVRLLRQFARTVNGFQKMYHDYLKNGQVAYDDIDRLVGSETSKGMLWRLKDDCHHLWRDADPAVELHGCLLDWLTGSLFHEAMKLKENSYLFHFYGPLGEKMKAEGMDFCGLECSRFMARIFRETERQMDSLGFMFGRAAYLLRVMLPEQSGNPLLLRFLLEHEVMARELWGESLPEIFADMFAGAPETGFCLAGRSYLEGNWYERAHAAYQGALAINRQCDEARHRSSQLRTLIRKNSAKEGTRNAPLMANQ